MNKKKIKELRKLIDDEDSSEDEIWEWCLEEGGYIEVMAQLLEKIPS